MIATMLDVAPDQVDKRATGEGLYSAFGLVFAGPRRYLDGHCPEAGPQAQPQLWVEVVHDAPHTVCGDERLVEREHDLVEPLARGVECPRRGLIEANA